MSFNLEGGLKSVINVIFWLWILLGIFLAVANFGKEFFLLFLIIGIFTPIVLRLIFFYIIGSFFK